MITMLVRASEVAGSETPLEDEELSVKIDKDFDFRRALVTINLCIKLIGLVGLYK